MTATLISPDGPGLYSVEFTPAPGAFLYCADISAWEVGSIARRPGHYCLQMAGVRSRRFPTLRAAKAAAREDAERAFRFLDASAEAAVSPLN